MIKINKELLTLNQDIAGQEIGIPVYRIFDDKNDIDVPTVYIQSAVHAAEMQGSAVIFKLITALKSLTIHAEFILVPNCNPFGRTQRAGEYLQGRFDATTGNNWNRFYHYCEADIEHFVQALPERQLERLRLGGEAEFVAEFKIFLNTRIAERLTNDWGVTTAQYLNLTLQSLSVEADLVLDLHTGPSSTRHIYSPEFLAQSARLFNVENIISIPASFAGALDEASFTPWCKLAECLKQRQVDFDYRVRAFTIELGSQENICLEQAQSDTAGILNYLQHNNLIDGFKPLTLNAINTTALKNYRTLFSKHAGMVEYIAKAGDKVQRGEVIARVLNSLQFENGDAIKEIRSPANGTVILHYPSAAVQIGTQLYKIAISDD